jgi:hypothetical protein
MTISKYDPLLKKALAKMQVGEKILVDDSRHISNYPISGFEILKLENGDFKIRQFYDPAQTECEVGEFSDIDKIVKQIIFYWR